MGIKKKITVRHVFERDYEIEFKDGEDDYGSHFCMADCMVCSGADMHDVLTHDFIFDNPVSGWRTAKGMNLFDTSLYNVSQSMTHITSNGTSIDAWLLEGEKDYEWKFPEDDEEEDEVSIDTIMQNIRQKRLKEKVEQDNG
jgi:hypothetical protein